MKQKDNDDVCNIMYRIRDCINADDVRRSLDLSKELYETLLKLTVNHEHMKCILDCELQKEEGK